MLTTASEYLNLSPAQAKFRADVRVLLCDFGCTPENAEIIIVRYADVNGAEYFNAEDGEWDADTLAYLLVECHGDDFE